MTITFGTNDGVWQLAEDTAHRTGLAGKEVSHVGTRNGATLAAVPYDGLYELSTTGARRIWEGDARSCAIGA